MVGTEQLDQAPPDLGDPAAWEAATVDNGTPTVGTPPKKRRGRPPGSGSRQTAKVKQLEADLATNAVVFGATIGAVFPTPGHVIIKRSTPFAQYLVALSKGNPAVLAALEKMTQVGPAVGMARIVIEVGVGFGVDLGRITPDSTLANVTGVTASWMEATQEGQRAKAAANGQVTYAPPPSAGNPGASYVDF